MLLKWPVRMKSRTQKSSQPGIRTTKKRVYNLKPTHIDERIMRPIVNPRITAGLFQPVPTSSRLFWWPIIPMTDVVDAMLGGTCCCMVATGVVKNKCRQGQDMALWCCLASFSLRSPLARGCCSAKIFACSKSCFFFPTVVSSVNSIHLVSSCCRRRCYCSLQLLGTAQPGRGAGDVESM